MLINILQLRTPSFFILLMLSFSSSISYAEIFKWVDENGQTHYSDKKSDAPGVVEKVKLDPSLNVFHGQNSGSTSAIKKEDIESLSERIQAQESSETSAPIYANISKEWGEDGPDTDAKKCALANDILNGNAVHDNGAPIDAHDLEVAQRDTRKYCH